MFFVYFFFTLKEMVLWVILTWILHCRTSQREMPSMKTEEVGVMKVNFLKEGVTLAVKE